MKVAKHAPWLPKDSKKMFVGKNKQTNKITAVVQVALEVHESIRHTRVTKKGLLNGLT